MGRSKEELKKLACEAIDKNRDKIIALGESIFEEPELGYKEVKTAEKMKKVFEELGIEYQSEVAITGVIAPLKGKESKVKVAVMGELDAVVAPGHRAANKETGAAHSCGHNAQCASVAGVAYALKTTGIMDELYGDVILQAVPAEEYVEIEYRSGLRDEGKISFLGGKQEFVKLGVMDDIDIMVMQHAGNGNAIECGPTYNGFIGKLVRYIGREAHAAGAPHLGINALSAANVGLVAIGLIRETFQEKDRIRVHPIITKGGNLVNVVPNDVRIETYVRGSNFPAIIEANAKVTRAFIGGGDAIGAQTVVKNLPGYMPLLVHEGLGKIAGDNAVSLIGADRVDFGGAVVSGSTDAGDISQLMPTLHAHVGGVRGVAHSSDYEIEDPELSYIVASKMLAMSVIDLLADGAEAAVSIKDNFKAPMTKDEYMKHWESVVNE